MFSVNEGKKFPITGGDKTAIKCEAWFCAVFGKYDLVVNSDSNNNNDSYCAANKPSFKLPAKGESYEHHSSSINGGVYRFKS
jgi:hypothetical protein